MNAINIKPSICLSMLFLLASCAKPEQIVQTPFPSLEATRVNETSTIQPPTASMSSTPAPTETKINVTFTPSATPAFVANIIYNPNQVTDGRLKMSIEEPDKKCHTPGEFIPIKIIYENLTDKRLLLVDFDALLIQPLMFTHGQVFPILTTKDNKRIRFSGDFSNMDLGNPNSPLFQEILPKSTFEYLVKYHLPSDSAKFDENQQFGVIPPGPYLLKFVYFATGLQDTWEGKVSSNQIEICIAG